MKVRVKVRGRVQGQAHLGYTAAAAAAPPPRAVLAVLAVGAVLAARLRSISA